MKGGGDGGRRYRSGFGGTPRQKRVLWLRYPKPAGRDSDCLVLGSQESHGLCVRARVGERVFTRLRACLCPRLSLFARYWQVLERAHSHRSRTPTTPAHILQYTRSHKLSLSLSLSPYPPPAHTYPLLHTGSAVTRPKPRRPRSAPQVQRTTACSRPIPSKTSVTPPPSALSCDSPPGRSPPPSTKSAFLRQSGR